MTNGYLLSLASLILLGGSLGDRFGRRRVFVVGVVWFAVASALCGLAPNPEVLIAARVLQGVGGALLTPGSLAMIQGAFVTEDRAPAIGAWSGLGGIAAAIGPFVGGGLVDYAELALDLPHQPAARRGHGAHRGPLRPGDPRPARVEPLRLVGRGPRVAGAGRDDVRPDRVGRLVRRRGGGRRRGRPPVGFVLVEGREAEPMLQLGIFRDRTFSASNAMTFLVYGALGAMGFFVTLQLQTVVGYGALAAGVAFLPMTVADAVPRLGRRPAGDADRSAAADDRRAGGHGGRDPAADAGRRRQRLLARRAPRGHALRPRAGG